MSARAREHETQLDAMRATIARLTRERDDIDATPREALAREEREVMRERPILFSGPMVKAILAGSKTMTRRVVKELDFLVEDGEAYFPSYIDCGDAGENAPVPCPYGAPGDSLWVKETHAFGRAWDDTRTSEMPLADGDRVTTWYRADDGEESWTNRGRWRPSIFLPRWASRITLPVTAVRVERLQDISPEDVLAEGVPMVPRCGCETCGRTSGFCPADASEQVMAYRALWESLNGAGSWDANSWVWVVTFGPAQVAR